MLYYSQVMRFNTANDVTRYNVTGLQPDSRYIIQVAAITRKGDGNRSEQIKIKTPGGVPSRPTIDLKYVLVLLVFDKLKAHFNIKLDEYLILLFKISDWWIKIQQ